MPSFCKAMFGQVSLLSVAGRVRRALFLSLLAALGGFLALPAPAAEGPSGLPLPRFATTRSTPINVRIGPGTKYGVAWVYVKAGTPVEIVQEFDTWRKVRLHDGDLGWIHASLLSGRRTALIAGEIRTLRQTPDEEARVVLRAEPGVIGELLDCDGDWCRVEIDGRRGWLQRSEFWGVLPEEALR